MLRSIVEEMVGDAYEDIQPISTSSHCFKATSRLDASTVVFIKAFDFSKDEKHKAMYANELRLLRLLHDATYICRLIDTAVDEKRCVGVIVQQYIDHDDLIDRVNGERDLHDIRHVTFVHFLFSHMIVILQDLKARGIVHCDIKPENILCEKNTRRLYVVDFEFSFCVDVDDPQPIRGTIPYVDHALFMRIVMRRAASNVRYAPQNDLWSTAVMIYRFLFLGLPWDLSYNDSILSKATFRRELLQWDFTMHFPTHESSDLLHCCINAISLCLVPHKNRPSLELVQEILKKE